MTSVRADAPPNPRTALSVDPFLDDVHRAFAARLAQARFPLPLTNHDARRAVAVLREQALCEWLVPASLGGREAGGDPARVSVRALCLAREWLAYDSPLADSIFAVQGLGSHALVLTESFPHREALLAEVRAGTRIGAFALTEPDAGSDVASLKTTATREGEGWHLDGEKIYISNAGLADHYIVFANADPARGKKGISAFLVDATAAGLAIERVPMSIEHPLGRLRFHRTPARALIGEVGHGMRLALGTLDVFRTSVGAAACGMARRALDEALAWVTHRQQFGKPLAEFQLTQARLANMWTELEAARLLVYRAAHAKDRGERALAEVAMAKMFATESAQRIVDASVQLHGGHGVTLSCPTEQLYREVRALRIYEGTTEIQQLILGGVLTAPTS